MFSARPSCFWLIALISLCWVLTVFSLRSDWRNFIDKDLYKKYVNKTGQQFNTNFFQGDIGKVDRLASEEQVATAFNTLENAKFQWPNAIVPFTISDQFSNEEQMLIINAITAITELTNDCVRFVERITDVDYIQIIRDLGCYSSGIGRQGGAQRVSFTTGCLEEYGDVQHEILHALGFYHEHTREDRDQHVTINWRNIREGDKVQFQKFNGLTFDLPYDYASVMHFPWNAFAINPNLPTMVPKEPGAMIGHRANLSSIDVHRIRRAYGCEEFDSTSQTGDMEITTTTTTTEQTTSATTTPMPTTTTPATVTPVHGHHYLNPNSNYLRLVTVARTGYIKIDTNGHLSGFIPEFVDILADLANFDYTLNLETDGIYRMELPQFYGTCNGMVGSLLSGNYDMIAADLTITADRSKVIDFTTPYMTTQLRILVNTQWATNNVTYLVLTGSAYAEFLQMSTKPINIAIWANIQANNGFVTSTQEGVKKVLAGGFAFIEDISTLTSALAANPKTLAITPDVLLSQFLAFGIQKGSPWRDLISIAISEANESGQLQSLLDKYGLVFG